MTVHERTKSLVTSILEGDAVSAQEHFQAIMNDKATEAIDEYKKFYASGQGQQEESDPEFID